MGKDVSDEFKETKHGIGKEAQNFVEDTTNAAKQNLDAEIKKNQDKIDAALEQKQNQIENAAQQKLDDAQDYAQNKINDIRGGIQGKMRGLGLGTGEETSTAKSA